MNQEKPIRGVYTQPDIRDCLDNDNINKNKRAPSTRYFMPLIRSLFVHFFDKEHKTIAQSILTFETVSKPVFTKDPAYKKNKHALKKASELVLDNAQNLPVEEMIIVSGVVPLKSLTETFSSWDRPVLINLSEIPVDQIWQITNDNGKVKRIDITKQILQE